MQECYSPLLGHVQVQVVVDGKLSGGKMGVRLTCNYRLSGNSCLRLVGSNIAAQAKGLIQRGWRWRRGSDNVVDVEVRLEVRT